MNAASAAYKQQIKLSLPVAILYDSPVKDTSHTHLFIAQGFQQTGQRSPDLTERQPIH